MKFNVYAIKDVHTGYLTPSYAQNDNVAIREFVAGVNQSPIIKQNPKDFDFRKIGEFDSETGVITPITEKVLYTAINAVGYLKECE